MGITDFFMKMNMATGGQNPNDALMEGIRSLGLNPVRQQGAYSEYGGMFGRRHAGMSVDGSALMQASSSAYANAAGLGVASALGVVSHGYADYATGMNDLHARSGMQNAQMNIRWWVSSERPAGGNVRITRDPSGGNPMGHGLFGAMDQQAWQRVTHPSILGPLSHARFHGIEVSGHNLAATWMPPMSEYQSVAASPQQLTHTSHAALVALSLLADTLCPS